MQHQRVRSIPVDLRAFHTRMVDVMLTPALSFRMQEALFQHQPNHWSRIWPSSVALSRWFLDQVQGSLPKSARELGCGMGLVSMTLAHLGVQIEGTDREPKALAFALGNAERNSLAGFSAAHLDWSEPEGEATQLMVAADIMYEPESPARVFALLQTAGLLLPQGRLVMASPRARSTLMSELAGRFVGHGYAHQAQMRVVEWEGRTEEIDIHLLTRPS
jgi:predicted nicotinamide N-methyase